MRGLVVGLPYFSIPAGSLTGLGRQVEKPIRRSRRRRVRLGAIDLAGDARRSLPAPNGAPLSSLLGPICFAPLWALRPAVTLATRSNRPAAHDLNEFHQLRQLRDAASLHRAGFITWAALRPALSFRRLRGWRRRYEEVRRRYCLQSCASNGHRRMRFPRGAMAFRSSPALPRISFTA